MAAAVRRPRRILKIAGRKSVFRPVFIAKQIELNVKMLNLGIEFLIFVW